MSVAGLHALASVLSSPLVHLFSTALLTFLICSRPLSDLYSVHLFLIRSLTLTRFLLLLLLVCQVNTQLYNAQEKETLEQLVNVMSMFSLTYAQKKGQESQYFYTMEP